MLPDQIEAIRRDYPDCFGCGAGNPLGLQLDDFRVEGALVVASFTPRPEYHGFSDLLHGGVVAAALDEIMAWTAIHLENVMVMTGTLDLRYRKPAPVDAEFVLEGELTERRGRRIRLAGRMVHSGSVVAQASGLFLVVADLDQPATI